MTDINSWAGPEPGPEPLQFGQRELEEGIHLLIKEGILSPVMKFRDEWRYAIADQSLRDLLNLYWHISDKIEDIILKRWKYIGRPTIEELKWFESLYGEYITKSIRLIEYQERRSLSKNKRKRFAIRTRHEIKKARKQMNEIMAKIEVDYAETVKNYKFPTEQLSEMIYPSYFRHAIWGYWMN